MRKAKFEDHGLKHSRYGSKDAKSHRLAQAYHESEPMGNFSVPTTNTGYLDPTKQKNQRKNLTPWKPGKKNPPSDWNQTLPGLKNKCRERTHGI